MCVIQINIHIWLLNNYKYKVFSINTNDIISIKIKLIISLSYKKNILLEYILFTQVLQILALHSIYESGDNSGVLSAESPTAQFEAEIQ